MLYRQPFDQPSSPNASYQNGDPVLGLPGSIADARAWEEPQREIINAITGAGLTPAVGDLTQLFQAMQAIAGQSNFQPIITQNRSYYVNTSTGSDGNTGLTSSTAFKTIGAAVAAVSKFYFNGYTVTINIADGTYAERVYVKNAQGGTLAFLGNSVNPQNVIIQGPAGDAFLVTNGIVTIAGVTFQTSTSYPSGAAGLGLSVGGSGANVTCTNVRFLNCIGGWAVATQSAQLAFTGTLTLSGNAGGTVNGFLAQFGANISSVSGVSLTLTISSAISVTTFLAAQYNATTLLIFSSIVGGSNLTANRYSASTNGVISANGGGATYYPGNTAGQTSSGGQYV